MELDDRVRIATPEGVDVELVVAGLGSRFIALLVDMPIQLTAILALTVGTSFLGDAGPAVFAVGGFLVFFGYPIAFETLAGGRTPGKMVAGLRVVTLDGSPVGFLPSAVRNVVRVVDSLPSVYVVGTVAVLLTQRNQRLGDLAAGTLVVRTPRPGSASSSAGPTEIGLPVDALSWDLSAVTTDEVATVRAFLERRHRLEAPARQQLAAQLASRLHGKVAGPPTDQGPERFLESLVAAKLARR